METANKPEFSESSAPQVLTLTEAATMLRCSKAHLCKILGGRISNLPPLPYIALGRRTLIRRVVLEQWLKRLEDLPDRR